MLMIASLFIFVAAGFNDVVGLYVNTYFWEFSTAQLAMLVWALFLAPLIAVSLTPAITRRFDKKRTMISLASIAIAAGPIPVGLRLMDLMPENGSPLLLPIIVVHTTLLITLVVAVGIVFASMIADTVDENELLNGRRQEGVFMAAIAFVIKATSGVGGLIAGIALDVIAFPTQAAPGTVPPEKLFNLGLVVGPGATLLIVVSLFFMARYRLTRERHAEILDELAARRRVAAAAGG
jgi:Na+/melibiose symporter-like transporter